MLVRLLPMSWRNVVLTHTIHNTPWHDLKPGDQAAIERTCQESDLWLFAHASGNHNPRNMPQADAPQEAVYAPSMWLASLVSAVLGNVLPGPGTLYAGQNLRFPERVRVGDRLSIQVRCVAKGECPLATFAVSIRNQNDTVVCEGETVVEAPLLPQSMAVGDLPPLIVGQKDHFAPLLDAARAQPALRVAVVCPEDHNAMAGTLLAQREGLIEPVLVGDPARIQAAAQALGADIAGWPLMAASDHHTAAALAASLARDGQVQALMKGSLHSDVLLHAVVDSHAGLRTGRRLSHVFVMNVATLDHLLFISDAAINIAPDLVTKVDIVQNTIDVAQACGLAQPRVGILSAVETVNPHIPSTLDAAALCKMADRGQIRGATLDGPLAMDNAIDLDAARTKGIRSLVAGRADALIVPNLEAGNMLAKELTFLAQAEAAGLAIGAKVPLILTSRADNDRARLVSCALAQLYRHWQEHGQSCMPATAEGAAT